MAATRTRARRRRGASGERENEERWLLTYSDMITLLMALFMVMFSISSVNTSKAESLQRSLEDAFSGKILPGGEGVTQAGGAKRSAEQTAAEEPIPAIKPISPGSAQGAQQQIKAEDETFRELKRRIDAYAKEHGIDNQIETSIRRRGLVITVLTDKLLFDSGHAVVKPAGRRLLESISAVLRTDTTHPIAVEGHTDSVPISTGRYPSNWELSTARASSVVRALAGDGIAERRFEAAGYAALHPIDSNSTDPGRTRNRRVEIVLLRKGLARQGGPVTP
jgi:chemotaxis protein MotB